MLRATIQRALAVYATAVARQALGQREKGEQ